jgi:ADP-glucose pyrophosphorylase
MPDSNRDYGSREIAAAAIKIALTSDRQEEKQLQAEYAKSGIHTVAVDYGGEFINSVMKIVERAVVSSKREGVINESHVEEGAVVEDSIIMSYSRVGANTHVCECIAGEKVTIGNNAKVGIGEMIANEHKPNIYNSGITVIGDEASVPDHAQIGKNVAIDIKAGREDFCSLQVPSGKSVYKGGVCE